MRIFVAVDISEETRALAAKRIEFLRSQFSDLRVGWAKPEKLHLTLKFLGEISENQLQNLISATEKAVSTVSTFELTIFGTGAFPNARNPRVLWLGLNDANGKLKELNQNLEQECFVAGFEREKRDFKPHLTIARLKEPNKAGDLTRLHLETDFPAVSFWVTELTIYKSDLKPHGSIYTQIHKAKLKSEDK